MTKIISISLNEDFLEDMEKIQKNMGFSGRSEVIRAGVRELIETQEKITQLNGKIEVVLNITHIHTHSQSQNIGCKVIMNIRHKFQSIVKTQIHHETKKKK